MHCLCDKRSDREILLSIERKLVKLMGEFEMDLYDRIIAGVTAIQAGDNQALEQHVAAIDTHLSAIDASELQLQGDDTASKGRLDAIEAGLGKIANAVSPVQTPAPSGDGTTSTPGSGGTSTPGSGGTTATDPGAPPPDGSQSGDVGPNGAPAAIPAAGVGSETTGQVDTPKTVG